MVEDTTIPNALGLSDEEFLKQDPSMFLEEEDKSVDISESSDSDRDNSSTEENKEDNSEAQEQTETAANTEEVSQPEGDTQTEQETSDNSNSSESSDTNKANSPDTEGDTQETKEFDYKSAYEKVTQPFKANGAEIAVKNPDDIVRLMQMGANYNKKMAQLKPNLKLIKMLDNNNLLNEDKLNNLIDLSKKDFKAIAKLIKESEMDFQDINEDDSSDYKPNDHSVSDKEFELDRVIEDIKETPTFDKTIDVLTKQWDSESKTIISANPEIIGTINTHMGNGVFDKINSLLQQEKTLGNLNGMSDVDAYWQIAESLHKKGTLSEQISNKDQEDSSKETELKEKAAAEAKKKKKAVAPVKQTTSAKKPPETNFLGLSDEEFMKKHMPI